MNFLHLKYFLMVAEEMNITRAAERLYISQQSLSNHIGNLEKELEFIAELGVKRICLQATACRPEVMDEAALAYELDVVKRFAEKTREFGIMSNLHPHHNTWVMYKE